jgi:hypothetical protein
MRSRQGLAVIPIPTQQCCRLGELCGICGYSLHYMVPPHSRTLRAATITLNRTHETSSTILQMKIMMMTAKHALHGATTESVALPAWPPGWRPDTSLVRETTLAVPSAQMKGWDSAALDVIGTADNDTVRHASCMFEISKRRCQQQAGLGA